MPAAGRPLRFAGAVPAHVVPAATSGDCAEPWVDGGRTVHRTPECRLETIVRREGGRTLAYRFTHEGRTWTAVAAEPAALKRQKLGVWVVLYLAFFTFLAWLLKKEYWKDVH